MNIKHSDPSQSLAPGATDWERRARWAGFIVMLTGSALPPLNFSIILVALAPIAQDLGADAASIQLVVSAYAGVYAIALITGGRLGDLFGPGRMFFLGLSAFGLASLLCALAWAPWVLIVGRLLQGLTAAVMAPQGLALIQTSFPEAEKSRALALYGGSFGLGTLAGQVLGGVLVSIDLWGLGWRLVFLFNLPIIAGAFLFGWKRVDRSRRSTGQGFDFPGVLLSFTTLALLLVPLTQGRQAGWPLWSWVMLAAAPLLAGLFLKHERALLARGGTPLIQLAAMRSRTTAAGLTAASLFYSIAALFVMFPFFLQQTLGQSPLEASIAFLPFGIGFLVGPLAGTLLAMWVDRPLGAFGIFLEVAGCLLLAGAVAFIPDTSAAGFLLRSVALFAIGVGQGIALPLLLQAITRCVDPGLSGMIAGILNSTLQLSAALSVAIIGGLFYTLAGEQPSLQSTSRAFAVAMIVVAICLAGAMRLVGRIDVPRGAKPAGDES